MSDSRPPRHDATAFREQCDAYLERLRAAGSFGEVLRLWRETTIPYSMPALDPMSPAYREQVLSLYQSLTRTSYASINELTSSKQSAESFAAGYPWVSRRLDVVASELAKTTQALQALAAEHDEPQDIVEFGCGWGNLLLPLAKAGQRVTAVDIDQGFLTRLENIFQREGLPLQCLQGDFLQVARAAEGRYDAVIFQSSFHHCLEFDALVAEIRDRMLKPGGRIFFLSEPIYPNFPFPWGLRYDGESLWAIMCNHWLELGFDRDFFHEMLARQGLLVTQVAPVPGFVGEGWKAVRGEEGLPFADWALAEPHDRSFWPRDANGAYGRFLRADSTLPRVVSGQHAGYSLTLKNFCPRAMKITIKGDGLLARGLSVTLAAGEERVVDTPECVRDPLRLVSDTVVPDRLIGNGDTRQIGCAVTRVRLNGRRSDS